MKKIKDVSTLEWCIVSVVAFAAAIIVTALLIPPPGEVHESVRECLWILLAFDGILAAVFAIHKGLDAKFTAGNTTIDLINPDNKDDHKREEE